MFGLMVNLDTVGHFRWSGHSWAQVQGQGSSGTDAGDWL